MPSPNDPQQLLWKATKRELTALDIVASDRVIQPVEFVKTKKHCYVIKEYANGGSLAQLLLMRSHIGIERGV